MTTPDSEVEHTHDHEHKSALRARSIESPLIENGLLTADIVDRIVRVFEEDIGPLNGAKIVAHAWSDPVYRHRLLQDGNAAIAELGFQLPQKLVVLENSAAVPNVFVSHCARVTRAVLGLLISSNTFAEIHDTISIRVWNGAVQAAASLIRLAARSDHVSIPSDAN